ncbi:hypothetical protein I7I50_00813 [Histoplasma capsulatum G186AR]|uniref:Secreted protein n=1 Tax=Ajellomyces capsulatus TaxID=5037 RepID=A0A8H7YGP1_AJECA|nr:hypothetical protein I7I52_08081 [Histoplasma capsulatum]QSS72843.1 hypothetical protein I7I50_00813 [Histoplasma capsulatum G186AR]
MIILKWFIILSNSAVTFCSGARFSSRCLGTLFFQIGPGKGSRWRRQQMEDIPWAKEKKSAPIPSHLPPDRSGIPELMDGKKKAD